MSTLSNVETGRGQAEPPCVRFIPDTIPEAKSSKTGVSVKYVPAPDKRWYVFRASYGREDKASDYIVEDGTFVYIAKRYARKTVNGKQKMVLETLIPNLLFVYANVEKANEYVNNTPALSYEFGPLIENEEFNIVTSPDKRLRIYVTKCDTEVGASMNLVQYRDSS